MPLPFFAGLAIGGLVIYACKSKGVKNKVNSVKESSKEIGSKGRSIAKSSIQKARTTTANTLKKVANSIEVQDEPVEVEKIAKKGRPKKVDSNE